MAVKTKFRDVTLTAGELNCDFNIVRIAPPATGMATLGFLDATEYVQCMLEALGYAARQSVNRLATDAVNIVVGAQAVAPEGRQVFAERCVFFNLEQLKGSQVNEAGHFRWMFMGNPVWDYSDRNLEIIREHCRPRTVGWVRFGACPPMRRATPAGVQDIDVLFYGRPLERRVRIIDALRGRGLNVETVVGTFGVDRDPLIARSRIVLTVHAKERRDRIFEMVRVSYALNSFSLVVGELDDTMHIDPEIRACVVGADYDSLVDTCVELLADPDRFGRTRKANAKRYGRIDRLPEFARLVEDLPAGWLRAYRHR